MAILLAMDNDARLCLAKSWEVIARLIMQIGLAVRLLTPLARAEHNRMAHLTRLAESLTRRWLVLKACELRASHARSPISANPSAGWGPGTQTHPTGHAETLVHGYLPAQVSTESGAGSEHTALSPVYRVGVAVAGDLLGKADAQRLSALQNEVTNPRPPLFRLVEPQPRFKHEDTLLEDACAQYGLDLPALLSAHPGLDPGSQDGLPDSWHEVPDQVRDDGTISPNPTPLWVRSRALIDVMQRRDHHVQRMARWLASAELKRQCGRAARLHPFRVGRPPGARRLPQIRLTRAPYRRPPKDPDKATELKRQATLRDLAYFAREALNQRAPP